jgi:hypothetical protein
LPSGKIAYINQNFAGVYHFLFHAWLHQFSLIPVCIVFHYFISQFSWFVPDTTVAERLSTKQDIFDGHASK